MIRLLAVNSLRMGLYTDVDEIMWIAVNKLIMRVYSLKCVDKKGLKVRLIHNLSTGFWQG